MREPVTEEAAIAAEIARIRSLPSEALRRRWQAVFGRKPPVALSKDLLGRMIAHHLQEQTFGGLDRDSLTFLDSLARQGGPPRRQFRRMSANFGGTGSGPAGVDPRVAAVDPAQLLEPLQERPGGVRPAGQLNNLMVCRRRGLER
jgi:hypothetical protein